MEAGRLGLLRVGYPLAEPPPVFRRQQRRLLQQPGHRLPDRLFRPVGPKPPAPADLLRTHPGRVVVGAAVVAVPVGNRAHVVVAAPGTDHKTPQKVRAARVVPGREPGVGGQLRLGPLPDGPVDDGRYRDGDPFLPGPPRLLWRRLSRCPLCPSGLGVVHFAVVVRAGVGLVPDDAPDGGSTPAFASPGRGNPLGLQTGSDGPQGKAVFHNGPEDFSYHRSLGFLHLEPAAPIPFPGNVAVPVGHKPSHHGPLTGPEHLAPPGALGDLGSLVFGNGPLHMEQELAFRGIVHGMVQELDGHAPALEFFQEKHLMADPAGQPVRRVNQQAVEFPPGRGVTQPLEGRPLKADTGVAVVHELGRDGVTPGLRVRPQGLQLAENGLLLFLTIRADPGVQGGPHRTFPFQGSRWRPGSTASCQGKKGSAGPAPQRTGSALQAVAPPERPRARPTGARSGKGGWVRPAGSRLCGSIRCPGPGSVPGRSPAGSPRPREAARPPARRCSR